MDYKIDFSTPFFGVSTLNRIGINLLVQMCGGEQMFIQQVNDARRNGIIDKYVADCCKAKIRDVVSNRYEGMYKRVKARGVGLVPSDFKFDNHNIPIDYSAWTHILTRVYSKNERLRRFYDGCKICEEWLHFENFREWYNKQVGCNLGYETDKDLLGNGKLYSPETCCLLPRELNRMISDRKTKNRELPTGVKRSGKRFFAQALIGTAEKKYIYLGNFDTPEEASNAYKAFRKKRIAETAQVYYDKGELDERAYNSLINFDA